MSIGSLLEEIDKDKATIEELYSFLVSGYVNKDSFTQILGKCFGLVDNIRSNYIKIDDIKSKIKIDLGDYTIDYATAERLKDSALRKIELLSALIKNSSGEINILEVIEMRDDLYSEYLLLKSLLEKAYWSDA